MENGKIEVLKARLYQANGKLMMKKVCKKHGEFVDVILSDITLYTQLVDYSYDGYGVTNPKITEFYGCPHSCGLCPEHKSQTILANLDLTNRCNMNCPICFANANATGYVYEPSFEEVVEMMKTLRANKPVPTPSIQFSGGEPTIYPRFFDVLDKAWELGFQQIQIATNGVRLAEEEDFAQRCADHHLHTVYLQFDGFNEETYIKARGRPMLNLKLKAIENCRNVTPPKIEGRRYRPKALSTILVPTVLKGINHNEVGEIVRFAIKNRDVIRGVNFQPVAFTGRISQEEREMRRYTITDLVNDLAEQTDFLSKEDFFPVACVAPISELTTVLHHTPKMAFTAHPHCGLATFLLVEDETDKIVPITRIIDVRNFFRDVYELAEKARRSRIPKFSTLLRAMKLSKYIRDADGGRISLREKYKILKILQGVFQEGKKDPLADFAWNVVFIGAMHFQDNYNYDIERVKRCVIHYVTPDQRIIPFCAYNGGPTYRKEIEKKYSIPLEEWKRRRKKST
ncbi:MAG TPA: radical SAM protein [Thermoplasmata archaeon]|nr:radical SAM protein [Thermoplasmata archaeon]